MDNYPEFWDEEEKEVGLVRLSRVTYHLAEDQPDAMGWKVADIEGIQLGKVSDLLADLGTGQIVFVAVTSDDTGKTALIPVEGAFLDLTNSILMLPVRELDIRRCPDFNDDVIDVMPYIDYWMRVESL